MNLDPLLQKPGSVIQPGMRKYLAFVPEHYVTKVPVPAVPEGESEEVVCTVSGAFAFDGAKGFKYVDCTSNSVSHEAATQGEEGSKSFRQKGGFYHPGSKKEAMAFAAGLINTPGFLLTYDRDGNQILVGQPGNPVSITCDHNFGKAATDAKGFTFSWEWDAPVPAYFMDTPVDLAALKNKTTENPA